MDTNQIQATGRRKRAIARVKLVLGQGVITVNKKPIEEYFPRPQLQQIVRQPLEATQSGGRFDIIVKAEGGGVTRTSRCRASRHRARARRDGRIVQRDPAQERFPDPRPARKRIEEVRPQARAQTLPVLEALIRALRINVKNGSRPLGGSFAFSLVPGNRHCARACSRLLVPVERAMGRNRFANGIYPQWQRAIFPITNALPWSLGDVAVVLGIALLVWRLPLWFRKRPKLALWRRIALAIVEVIGILGLYLFLVRSELGLELQSRPD